MAENEGSKTVYVGRIDGGNHSGQPMTKQETGGPWVSPGQANSQNSEQQGTSGSSSTSASSGSSSEKSANR